MHVNKYIVYKVLWLLLNIDILSVLTSFSCHLDAPFKGKKKKLKKKNISVCSSQGLNWQSADEKSFTSLWQRNSRLLNENLSRINLRFTLSQDWKTGKQLTLTVVF